MTTDVTSNGWLRGRSFDTVFIVGVLFLALFSGAVVAYDPKLFVIVFFLDLWFLGYHHVVSTYTRLCFDSASGHERRHLIIGLLPLVLLIVFLIGQFIGYWAITTIYLYWQWFHYTRQSWGIQQAYRAKSSDRVNENPAFIKVVFYLVPLWGILYRSYQYPDKFLGIELWVIPVPYFVVLISGCLAIGSCVIWAYLRIQAHRAGNGPLAHTLYMTSHLLIFLVGYLVIEDITHGWLVINIWHNTQYILFVWFFNSNKFKEGVTMQAHFLSWISQPNNWWIYFAVCMVLTTVLYVSLGVVANQMSYLAFPAAIVIYQSLNFHHYIVDSIIWKLRKPNMRNVLSISDA